MRHWILAASSAAILALGGTGIFAASADTAARPLSCPQQEETFCRRSDRSYTDTDGDGICDNYEEGQHQRAGARRGAACPG